MAAGISFAAVAATKTQSVMSRGTTVATAKKNVVADNECTTKYNACMDTFCILDNDSGGRCQCSNDKRELDKQLAEIDAASTQADLLNTIGQEAINSTAAQVTLENAKKSKDDDRQKRLSAIFDLMSGGNDNDYETPDELAEKTGAELLSAANEICTNMVGTECKSQMQLTRALYTQSVRSDCAAYKNALAAKKKSADESVAAAQSNLRSAALTQYQDANKYDLGQCAVEFQNCMMTTAGCGNDFTGCVGTIAADNMQNARGAQMHTIKGAKTQIQIAHTTYEILDAKRPMCDRVLKSCVNVADDVWDTFLRAAAPSIKMAELNAESDLRQSCMTNIAECIQNACRDNIDPNNPDSYDLCLSRPESVQSLCKPQIEPCVAANANIMDYVYMRLAAMRVNACTDELKSCLTDTDRCGPDYTQCIGLETNTIIRMCPYEKLIACQKQYGADNIRGDAVYDELSNVVQGIMLNIDDSLATFCQNAVNDAMVKVCGDTSTCNNSAIVGNEFGGEYLNYRICPYVVPDEKTFAIDYDNCKENVAALTDADLAYTPANGGLTGVIDGMMYWGSVDVDDTGNITNIDKYIERIGGDKLTDEQRERTRAQLAVIQDKIEQVMNQIEAEPVIQWCRDGREVPGLKRPDGIKKSPRYPGITDQIRVRVSNSLMNVARDNYQNKYNILMTNMTHDYGELGRRVTELDKSLTDLSRKYYKQQSAQRSCLALADMTLLPKHPTPPTGNPTKWIVLAVVIAAIIVASVFTFGAAAAAAAPAVSAITGTTIGTTVGTTALSATATAASASVGVAALAPVVPAITTTMAIIPAATTAAGTFAGLSVGAAATTAAVLGTAGVVGAAALGAGELGAHSKEIRATSGDIELPLTHTAKMESWNYRDTITATFDPDNFTCTKCTVTQECEKNKNPVFGERSCKKWKEEVDRGCEEIQF